MRQNVVNTGKNEEEQKEKWKAFLHAVESKSLSEIERGKQNVSMSFLSMHEDCFQDGLHSAIGRNERILLFLLEIPEIKKLIDKEDRLEEISPLHYSIKYGFDKARKILLRAGASIELSDSAGKTTMHYAVEACNLEMVKYLLHHSQNEQCHNYTEGDRLPIHYLFSQKNILDKTNSLNSVFEVLLSEVTAMELGKKDSFGKYLFHYFSKLATQEQMNRLFNSLWPPKTNAFQKEERKIVTYFLEKDQYGKTVLHIAAESGNLGFLRFIFDKLKKFKLGRDLSDFVNAKDKKNKTAFDCVTQTIKKNEVIGFLKDMEKFGFVCEADPNYPKGEERKSELHRLFPERFELPNGDVSDGTSADIGSSADMSNGIGADKWRLPKGSRGSQNDGPPRKKRKLSEQHGLQQSTGFQCSSALPAEEEVAYILSGMANPYIPSSLSSKQRNDTKNSQLLTDNRGGNRDFAREQEAQKKQTQETQKNQTGPNSTGSMSRLFRVNRLSNPTRSTRSKKISARKMSIYSILN